MSKYNGDIYIYIYIFNSNGSLHGYSHIFFHFKWANTYIYFLNILVSFFLLVCLFCCQNFCNKNNISTVACVVAELKQNTSIFQF